MRFCKKLCKITQNFGYSLILAQNKVVNIYFVKESLQLKYCVRDRTGDTGGLAELMAQVMTTGEKVIESSTRGIEEHNHPKRLAIAEILG